MRAGLRAGSRVGHPRSTQRAGEERHSRDLEWARSAAARGRGMREWSRTGGRGSPGGAADKKQGTAEEARCGGEPPLPSDGKAQVFTN
uniref:Uncharacterized protein n=1 Tax=Knipowitschia caucasica TaxID=637954 RepID=A0AAV2JAT9_KNICA